MKNKLLNISHVPRKTFEKHFLHSVHSVIELDNLASTELVTLDQELSEKLQFLNYSRKNPIVSNSVKVSIVEDQSSIEHTATGVGLSYSGDNPKFELQVAPNGVLFSDYSYTGFDNFKARFSQILDVVVEVTGKTNVNRVGLRKVNSFIVNSVQDLPQLYSVFNPALFSLLRSGIADADSAKFLDDVFVIEKEGKTCRLLHSMRKLDGDGKFELKLDFDIIATNPPGVMEIFDDELDVLNDIHFDIFMWSITSDLITLMEQSNEQ